MALQDGTFVVADQALIQAVDYALTLKYNEEPTMPGRRRRSSVNDAGLGTGGSSTEYRGMFHLGVEKETVGDTEKVYLTVDWPESESSDPTLVGLHILEIHYEAKSIELTEDSYIYFDYYYQRIIAAGFSQLPAAWNFQDGRSYGLYVLLLGKYESESKTVSQLWRADRNYNYLSFDYGMFHGFLELDVENSKVKTGKIYFNMDWDVGNHGDYDFLRRDAVGIIDGMEVKWPGRVELDPAVPTMIYYDPAAREIRIVKNGETVVSNWFYLGKFMPNYCSVESILQQTDYNLTSGLYYNDFGISYDKDADAINIQGKNTDIAGHVSVNNSTYKVANYTGALGEESKLYYFVRHRVAQTVTSGDEDQDLTEEQKQALRNAIAQCDTEIYAATQTISQYAQQIASLEDQRRIAYNAIATENSNFLSRLDAENSRHTSALNSENEEYNQKVNAENTLNQDNLATLQSTYDAGVAAENTTHQNNLNDLDPAASDYEQKVAAENSRHTQKLAELQNTYNGGVRAENTRHNAKLQELLTEHKSAISSENTTHSSNMNSLATARNSAISTQQGTINGINNQIAALRNSIIARQAVIMEQTNRKNTYCLQLYGVIPASAGCEIVALPTTDEAAQTDQYLYIYIGSVTVSDKTLDNYGSSLVTAFTAHFIEIDQAYQGSIMAFYRVDTSCGGLLS